jgi:hypothetical protein
MLGLEAGQSSLDQFFGEPAAGEVVPNQGISGVPLREQFGPPPSDSLVVDRPGRGQSSDHLASLARSDARARQPLAQLAFGQIPARKHSRRTAHRLMAAQLSIEPAGPLAIELDSDRQVGGQ